MDHDIDVFERQEGEQLRYIKVIVFCILKSEKTKTKQQPKTLISAC